MIEPEAIRADELRQRARMRIAGSLPLPSERQSAGAALGLLHDLASSPVSAAGALALLHELQVQQVELTLQDEDMRAAVDALSEVLDRQLLRHEFAPVALYGIDQHWTLLEVNLAGVQLLAMARESALGRPLTDAFDADDGVRLRALLSTLRLQKGRAAVRAVLAMDGGPAREVQVTVAADPSLPQRFMVAVTPVPRGID